MSHKIVEVAGEALLIIAAMEWEQVGDVIIGRLVCGQLERELYLAVNKGLEALGGKWNRCIGGHVFRLDPRSQLIELLDNGKIEIEKDGYFPTPADVGRFMASLACISPGMRVLEPSAGTGELAEAILKASPDCELWVAEKDERRQKVLAHKGMLLLVNGPYDFLTHDIGTWPRIVQNPPFERGQDILHVRRAHECLEPGGMLISVVSEGPFFRKEQKYVEFREWLDKQDHNIINLEAAAFRESGTDVKARIVIIWKGAGA